METVNDLITAVATSDAVSAIAIVRLSGKGASKVVEELMCLKPGKLTGTKRAVGDFAGIDYLAAISWSEGKSYTGEEMVELMCHGTHGTARSIVRILEACGARLAQPGEFTKRAWMNGRITTLDVISLSARYTGMSTEGTGSLSTELIDILTDMEAMIEFSEDHEIGEEKRILQGLKEAQKRAAELTEKVKKAEILPKVFIMGPVNAGKSSLFNKLCGHEAAVVSETPGTTRDGAVRTVNISGRRVEVSDTAGYGGESFDQNALVLAIGTIRKGDRIVWMDPLGGSVPIGFPNEVEVFKVISKSDNYVIHPGEGWISSSSFTEQGLDEIKQFMTATEKHSPSWKLERMVELLTDAVEAAKNYDFALSAEIAGEILLEAEKPERCGDAVERALERFCVGK
jgi:tRNA modification GTPase